MQSNKELGAHALLVAPDGKILLVLKGSDYTYDRNNAGKVSMFGGRIESGEDVLTGLRRELSEELGLEISPDRARELNVYQKTKELDGADVEVHIFVVSGIDPAAIHLQAEGSDIETPDVNEKIISGTAEELLLRADLTRITRMAIEDFITST